MENVEETIAYTRNKLINNIYELSGEFYFYFNHEFNYVVDVCQFVDWCVQVPVMDSTNNVNHQHYSSATSSPGNNSNNGPTPSRAGPSTSPGPGSPLQQLQLTPVLLEAQINRLADAADLLVRSLPAQFEPRPHSAKKKVCKELEVDCSYNPQESNPIGNN